MHYLANGFHYNGLGQASTIPLFEQWYMTDWGG
jgi:hypothetical protein